MLSRDTWLKYKDKLSVKDLPRTVAPLYSILDNFHQNHEQDLTVGDFANLVLASQQKDPDYYKAVLQQLDDLSVSDTTTEVLIQSFYKQRLLKEISLTAYDITEGKGNEEAFQKLISLYAEDKTEDTVTEEFEFVTDDLDQLLNETFRQPGLRWRLKTLNTMLGSLRAGDFGFIFARPETGKTTFLASETTFMAQQLSADAGPIIWFNNEEQHNKVRIRCFQATLGATLAQINSNPEAARNAFLQATKGKHQLLNTKGAITKELVERVVRKYRPSLVIYDQIDKIHGFRADREDLIMGAIYQWARELAKDFQHAAIGVCQADGTGEGQKWLTMSNVANAKTAKQAEADWILGIGKVNDMGYEMVRYLHASKNKLAGDEDSDPTLRHGKREVIINPSIARYEEIQ
jgi:KaiC/GvpD/RAD55 family RecA-like ATPase